MFAWINASVRSTLLLRTEALERDGVKIGKLWTVGRDIARSKHWTMASECDT